MIGVYLNLSAISFVYLHWIIVKQYIRAVANYYSSGKMKSVLQLSHAIFPEQNSESLREILTNQCDDAKRSKIYFIFWWATFAIKLWSKLKFIWLLCYLLYIEWNLTTHWGVHFSHRDSMRIMRNFWACIIIFEWWWKSIKIRVSKLHGFFDKIYIRT